jgi:DNA repair exonuclease SbcCD ATPase subunit
MVPHARIVAGALVLTLVFAASCTKDEAEKQAAKDVVGDLAKAVGGEKGSGTKLPVTIPASQEELLKKATEGLEKAAGRGIEGAKEAAEELKKARPEIEKELEKLKETAPDAAKQLEELPEVVDTAFSVEKLKELAGGLSVEKLQSLAGELSAAVQLQKGAADTLKQGLDQLPAAVLGTAEGAELKKQLASALSELDGLKKKLAVAVDALKAKGTDVSRFVGILGEEK